MTEQTKSLIRHLLTAVGFLLAALGIADAAEIVDLLLADLDKTWDAILVLVGAVTTIGGFFKGKERFEKR